MRFDSLTQAIFTQYRNSFNRNFAAALSLLLVGLVAVILWLEYQARSRAAYFSQGTGSAAGPAAGAVGALALGGDRLLLSGHTCLPGLACGGDFLLAAAIAPNHRSLTKRYSNHSQLGLGRRSVGGVCHPLCPAHRRAGGAIAQSPEHLA